MCTCTELKKKMGEAIKNDAMVTLKYGPWDGKVLPDISGREIVVWDKNVRHVYIKADDNKTAYWEDLIG